MTEATDETGRTPRRRRPRRRRPGERGAEQGTTPANTGAGRPPDGGTGDGAQTRTAPPSDGEARRSGGGKASNGTQGSGGGRSSGRRPDGGGRRGHGASGGRTGGFRAPSPELLAKRRAALPTISYPAQLPVSARREEIADAIRDHQVVIVAGETGSGKTTQIPKICLELGRGVTGTIGHTQPRRIAARTVAERIAEELGVPLGGAVGYQVRFTDQVSETTLIKIMTDGILLAEIQRDPLLRRYDTIIVDEAHERTLNIDFLLGFLHQLLPKRPDLKVIVTSATIDSARFAEYFAQPQHTVPVVEVSGRTYPVDVRYRPLLADLGDELDGPLDDDAAPLPDEEAIDQNTAICRAADELMAEGSGDILVFLSGEREIRDAADALAEHLGPRYVAPGGARASAHAAGAVEVIPLYARLSAAEQHRVFEHHTTRRIVLATNVAETSLTVPGIRYVIDPGTARISRYSNRTKVQRLPIEPVSQASANQRAGRCGRVADGICIRLYSQRDYEGRPEYTEPEILRTSLASVILQMTALGLGDVAQFDFLDSPDSRAVKDGLQLLHELNAIEAESATSSSNQLTRVGRALAQLPIDPRLGRMLVEAGRLGCVREVMVIVAGLSVQDVRERPTEHQQAADEKHRRFADPTSDFLSLLKLWDYLKEQQGEMGSSAFRRLCRAEYLNFLRVREWQDVHTQLRQMAKPLGLESHHRGDATDPDRVHQALLSGLLSHVGSWDERRRDYVGARGTRFVIFPGSHLAKKNPAWIMAGELVETSRLFARTVARIKPEWAEPLAEHLVKRTYSEPYWSTKQGAAMVKEKVLLYGVPIVNERAVPLARVDGPLAREMFLRHALVEGEWRTHHAFFAENNRLLEEAQSLEARSRRRDLVIDSDGLFDFYDERIPEDVTTARHFDAWWKNARTEAPDLLSFTTQLLVPEADSLDADAFPDTWRQDDLTLPLTYQFEPGTEADGVTVHIPISVLNRVRPDGFDWMVPGLVDELAVATIRSLPKALRRQLVPAPDVAREIVAQLPDWSEAAPAGSPTFAEAFAATARALRDVEIDEDSWAPDRLPPHLRMTFRVQTDRGATLAEGKDLVLLQRQLARESRDAVRSAVRTALTEAQAAAPRPGAGPDGEGRPGVDSPSGGRGRVTMPDGAGGPGGHGTPGGRGPGRAPGGAGGSHWSGRDGSPPGPGAPGLTPGLAEQTGLTTWPDLPGGRIPDTVSSVGAAGLEIRGYPALADERGDVALRVLANAPDQAVNHRAGVLRLLYLGSALATGRITSRWSSAQSLALATSPYKNTDALVADLQIAAISALVAGTDLAGVRDRAAFEALLARIKPALEDEVLRVAELTVRILTASRELEATIRSTTSMALLNVLTDVRDQHAALVHPHFLRDTPPEHLVHLPRYLRAAVVRLEKAAENPNRDADRAWTLGELHEAWWSTTQAAAHDPVRTARLAEIRWQLEELRVSYFAQQLGTPKTVSDKRIRKALADA
nr:ATP-dependent RNA helicase HrpA [Occultella gossypii]